MVKGVTRCHANGFHAAAVAVERALQARPVELRLVVVADLLPAPLASTDTLNASATRVPAVTVSSAPDPPVHFVVRPLPRAYLRALAEQRNAVQIRLTTHADLRVDRALGGVARIPHNAARQWSRAAPARERLRHVQGWREREVKWSLSAAGGVEYVAVDSKLFRTPGVK